eukprot:2188944-Lingulodinium_polyedra.AAC.1
MRRIPRSRSLACGESTILAMHGTPAGRPSRDPLGSLACSQAACMKAHSRAADRLPSCDPRMNGQ